jgi:Uma2 family endonuclease
MATQPRSLEKPSDHYPTRDGKPVGETPVHRDILFELVFLLRRWFEADPVAYVSGNFELVFLLRRWFEADPVAYVSGNMMMYYVRGDKRKHGSPDVFVTLGIPDDGRRRDAYFVWEEGKGPDFVVELTSKSTRREDQGSKLALYRDVLHVREYFLFDPYGEYLKPPLKGFRLVEGQYQPIDPVEGRLPSEVTGLHLEPVAEDVRLYDPVTGRHLTPSKDLPDALGQVLQENQRLEAIARDQQAEVERLRREVEDLRSKR